MGFYILWIVDFPNLDIWMCAGSVCWNGVDVFKCIGVFTAYEKSNRKTIPSDLWNIKAATEYLVLIKEENQSALL